MTKSTLLLLAATCITTLSSCGDSDTATAPGGGASVPFQTAALGTWTAIKPETLTVPFLTDSMTLYPKIEIRNSLASNFTFAGEMFLRDIFGGNGVDSALYKTTGDWGVVGDSLLIMTKRYCFQAEMKPTAYGTLPFSAPPGLKANDLLPVPCGAPDTIRTKPVGNTWTVPLVVNMPGLATGAWSLSFTR